MSDTTPYEFYNKKLGLKVEFLTIDLNHKKSINVITVNALGKRMRSKTCTENQLRRASLGNPALILFSSLCREWKDMITTKFGSPTEEAKKTWFSQHYEADRQAFDFYVSHRWGEDNQNKLDLKFVEEYTYNASVLNTVLKMKANRTAYARALGVVRLDIWKSLSNDVNVFRQIDHTLPATPDGLRRKASTYSKALKINKNEAFKTIISGRLQNSNAKKVTEKEQLSLLDELINKHTNLDNELISTLYNVVAEKFDWQVITSMTVWNRKNKKKVVNHAARNGVKSLKNNVLMQVKRSKPTTPMLYWTLDGWDVELAYQKTHINKDNKTVTTYHNRLTMVLVLDAYNNYPVGFAIGTHETPALIKQALQNAMQHAKDLFGDFYRPYQLQMDNYAFKTLKSTYKAMSETFKPASVGNAKAKIIEPYFNTINKKYCKLLKNWTGHNVDSGSKNQPNDEYMNKIKKQFPDQDGCVKQIQSIVTAERGKKGVEYSNDWINTKEQHKSLMSLESYLLTFGANTGNTNKLKGEGLVITIHGQKHTYESFDINFRHQAHLDWSIQYDTNDLTRVLAVSTDGSERFILNQVYIQPMAIADRSDADDIELQRIQNFNKNVVNMIVDERAENSKVLDEFLDHPELNDTLAKHLLTDSIGQHKNNKSKQRLNPISKAKKLEIKQANQSKKTIAKSFKDEQEQYYSDKINVNEYLDN